MSSEPAAAKKKLPVLKLVVIAVVLGGIGLLVLRGVDLKGLVERGMTLIRDAGPVAFFTAMTILPALGVPSLTFSLTAGPAFGEKLGMPLVVALSLAAYTVNLLFSYALARRTLRPFLEALMTRLGYQLPTVEEENSTDLIVLMRVTPGIPFFVQNYLLGLAKVPFGRYVLISCIVTWLYTAGFVLFGDALLHGKGKMVLLAASLLVVAAVVTNWARKHYSKKKTPAI